MRWSAITDLNELGQEALYYQTEPNDRVRCLLCPQSCRIKAGQSGYCQVRRNRAGRLESINYARVASLALDPIEKKPLYHYFPGKPVLSAGTIGCNLGCSFCQNWQISRELAPTQLVPPADLVDLAIQAHQQNGSIGLAYTYSEPGVWFEYLRAVQPRIRERGLKNILVTNAYLNPEPWQELLHYTDAANIDLKGFDDQYYRRVCHGRLKPVLDNITAASGRIHLELTNLVVPGENDRPEAIRALAKWIADLDPEIPLHLSRYFPNYQMTRAATPLPTMETARQIAAEYLKFVYLGNLGTANHTCCPDCGAPWIERQGYRVKLLAATSCPGCGRKIPLIITNTEGLTGPAANS